MFERRHVEGIENQIGSYEGRDPASEPTIDVEIEWAFSHHDLLDWDECNGEFKVHRMFFKEHSIIVYECTECQEMRILEELQIAAAEVYGHGWESHCKQEVVR